VQYNCTVCLLQIYTNLLYKKNFHFYLVLIIICVILRHKALVDKIKRQAVKIYINPLSMIINTEYKQTELSERKTVILSTSV
jgi:hypothetical protein